MTPSPLPLRLSLQESVAYWALYQPEKPALVGEAVSLSYAQVLREVLKLRSHLRDLHVDRQATIGLCFSSKIPLLLSLCAVLSEGHAAAILNPQVDSGGLASMIRDGDCIAVMTDRPPGTSTEEWSHCATISVPHAIPVPDERMARELILEPVRRYAEDTWGIIYSSGTTGRPKGIVRTDLSILMELIGWCIELPITRSVTLYVGRPVYYTGGLLLAAATILVGGTVVLPEDHSIVGYRNWIATSSIDVAFLIPDQVRALVAAAKNGGQSWAGPRVLLTMGAPIDLETKAAIPRLLGCKFVESWGNSEGLGTITDPEDVTKRPRSIGRPFLADRMLVLGDDNVPVTVGEVGRLAGHADSSLREYKNRDDLNAALIRGDLVISEDLGYRDAEGYYYLAGRVSERIVRRGMPLFGRDIEEKVLRVPMIAEVAVVGLDDPADGQVPAALVVLRDDGTDSGQSLLAEINTALTEAQQLRIVLAVRALPRNAAGKVDIAGARTLLTTALKEVDDTPARSA